MRRLRVEPLEERQMLTAGPTVSATVPSLGDGFLPVGVQRLDIAFSAAVLGGDVASNYQLQGLGPDSLLGTSDDVVLPVTASYTATTATLNFTSLVEDVYRLTVHDTITDALGNKLDGDANGMAGSDWVRDFVVNRLGGRLDPSFDGDGKVTTDFSGLYDVGYSVAIQSDGKIVVAGDSSIGSAIGFALVRYLADGSLDTSFDGDGKVTTDFGASGGYGRSMAIQSDGKIVVAGYAFDGANCDFALVRYLADGSLDTSFDGDGKLITDFDASEDQAFSVAIQSDGGIVVAGYSSNGGNWDFALARYLADGTLDTSFDGDGKLTTDLGALYDNGVSVAIQSDGKIVVAGCSSNGNRSDFALVRYLTDGSLDTSFDGDGKVATDLGASDVGRSVAIRSDGKIVVAGDSWHGSKCDFALARYLADGTLDTSLDGDGKLTTGIGGGFDFGYAVALQPDGKIVVAGASSYGGNYAFAVARYGAGSVDLLSSHGFRFDVDSEGWDAGELIDAAGAADGLVRLQVGGTDYSSATSATLDDGGRTAVTAEQSVAGLAVHREITVPNTGNEDFARTVDVFTNPSGSSITTTVRIVGNLGSDAATTVFATSDGDTTVETTDQWIGTDDADGSGTPAVIHYIRGPRGLQPSSVSVTGDNIEWTYELTVPAGQTVRLAHFTILADTRAEAIAAASTVASKNGLKEGAGVFLTQSEKASLANFDFNRPTLPGVYDPKLARFYLRNSNTQGPADNSFLFGSPGWEPISGDWDGDGRETIGAYQRDGSHFHLRNSNTTGTADLSFGFGSALLNYTILVGDWNGDGIDTVGLYDPASSHFFLRNSNTTGVADVAFGFGVPRAGWTPLVGDWNGDGIDTVGLYDPKTGMFYLRNSLTTGMADVAFAYGVPKSGWLPLVGDWNGDGVETIGMFLPSASTFFLRNSNTTGVADVAFGLGYPGCKPIVGDWLGRDAIVPPAADLVFSRFDADLLPRLTGGLEPALGTA